MSFMDVFKREAKCEMCQMTVEKKKLFGFDSTVRGEVVSGEKLKLCMNCFSSKLEESIKSFPGRIIFYQPIKNKNAYQFYAFNASPKEQKACGYNDEFPYIHKDFLSDDIQSCEICQKDARHVLCTSKDKKLDIFNMTEYSMDGLDVMHLCADCVSKKLIDVIISDNIVFYELLTPKPEHREGIYVSGEA